MAFQVKRLNQSRVVDHPAINDDGVCHPKVPWRADDDYHGVIRKSEFIQTARTKVERDFFPLAARFRLQESRKLARPFSPVPCRQLGEYLVVWLASYYGNAGR